MPLCTWQTPCYAGAAVKIRSSISAIKSIPKQIRSSISVINNIPKQIRSSISAINNIPKQIRVISAIKSIPKHNPSWWWWASRKQFRSVISNILQLPGVIFSIFDEICAFPKFSKDSGKGGLCVYPISFSTPLDQLIDWKASASLPGAKWIGKTLTCNQAFTLIEFLNPYH